MFALGRTNRRQMSMAQRMLLQMRGTALSETTRNRLLPRRSPKLMALYVAVGQDAADLMRSASKINRSKIERLHQLIDFLYKVVSSRQQRVLLITSTGLSFAATMAKSFYQHYQQSVLVTTISMLASRAANAATGGKVGGNGGGVSSNGGVVELKRVISITVMLRVIQYVLNEFATSIKDAGNAKIRGKLSDRLTRHVLSQDLEDVDAQTKGNDDPWSQNATTPQAILRSLSDQWDFARCGLGQIIQIPEGIMDSIAKIISSATILLGKSPSMVIILYFVMVAGKAATEYLHEGSAKLSEWCGLDKPLTNPGASGTEYWGIDQVLNNFEDMRVNAKELEILKGLKKKSSLEELENNRQGFVASVLSPAYELLRALPSTTMAFVGGTMAMNGTMNAVDIVGFDSAVTQLVDTVSALYAQVDSIYALEDSSFEFCFNLIDLLNKQPKIGLEGGYKPPAPEKASAGTKLKLTRELEDPQYRIGGDIEIKNVTFKSVKINLWSPLATENLLENTDGVLEGGGGGVRGSEHPISVLSG